MDSNTQPLPLPQAVFFDLDQTLIRHSTEMAALAADTLREIEPARADACDAFTAALAVRGADLWERIQEHSGRGEQVLLATLTTALEAVELDPGLAPRMLRDLVRRIVDSSQVTLNAHRTLKELRKAGMILGIVTNGLSFLQTHKAEAHGLLGLVDSFTTSEEAGAHKPDRRIFDVAMRKAGVAPAAAWFVGDSYRNDILGGDQAGLTTLLFDPENTHRARTAAQCNAPRFVVRDLFEVVQLVEKMATT